MKPMLQAKHVDAEGFVTDSYEQKFAVPDDVDTARLSSGISKDGVLMIRVPRRPTEADRLIPIQYDAKIEAVEKALSQAMQSEKVREAPRNWACRDSTGKGCVYTQNKSTYRTSQIM